MRTLHQTLTDMDESVLVSIALAWGVKPTTQDEIVEQLNETMLDEANAEKMWTSLSDPQRQALQTVLGSGGRMFTPMFKRLFGDIRRMGRGAVERDLPHKNPQSNAEALYYRGLVAEMYVMEEKGSQSYIYVPEDLELVLPSHKTAYENLEAPEPDALAALNVTQLGDTRPADTSIVDDMTTLLAFLQLHAPPIDNENLAEGSLRALIPHLLVKNIARVAFMVAIGIDAGLIEVQEGRVHPRRAEARRFLEANRADQIEMLIKAWIDSPLYREMWHVPGLKPERVPGYEPQLARRTTIETMRVFVPESDWWDMEEFIYAVKESNADFQRPNGDYDSWYIMDIGGEYVHGFESWDTVEGPLLEFIITGPMHWLGLLDIAPEAARLTAYGRGVLQIAPFPKPADQPEPIVVQDDGTLLISRKVSRIDRFQVARFTTWLQAPQPNEGTPYAYVLDARGIGQADAQGINTGHISAFLHRILGDDPVPEYIERLLKNWRSGDAAEANIETLSVLRTTSEDVMNSITDTPELRRYLGARLGPRAVIVRAGQESALQDALAAFGVQASWGA